MFTADLKARNGNTIFPTLLELTDFKGIFSGGVRKSMISMIFYTFGTILFALHSTSFIKFHHVLVKNHFAVKAILRCKIKLRKKQKS